MENNLKTDPFYTHVLAVTITFIYCAINPVSAEDEFDTDSSIPVESILPPAFINNATYEFEELALKENLFYQFTVETEYGLSRVSSIAMLRRRLGEMTKLNEIARQSPDSGDQEQFLSYGEDDVFSDALGTAWRIRRPSDIEKPAMDARKIDKDLLEFDEDFPSIQWRTAAARTGLDPYSSFPPVRSTLEKISKTLGSDRFPSSVSPLAAYQVFEARYPLDEKFEVKIATTIKNSTAAELRDEVVRLLTELEVDLETRVRFMSNRAYIESDRFRFAQLLVSADKLTGKNLLVASASTAETEVDALAFLNYVRLVSAYNSRVAPLVTVLGVTRYPALVSSEGVGLLALPIDYLPWNDRTAALAAELTNVRDRIGLKAFTVIMLGKPTERAQQELKQLNVQLIDSLAL